MIGCSHDQFKFRMDVLVKLSLRKIEAVLSTMEKVEAHLECETERIRQGVQRWATPHSKR